MSWGPFQNTYGLTKKLSNVSFESNIRQYVDKILCVEYLSTTTIISYARRYDFIPKQLLDWGVRKQFWNGFRGHDINMGSIWYVTP